MRPRGWAVAIVVCLAYLPASTAVSIAQDEGIGAVGADAVEAACRDSASAGADLRICPRALATIPPGWVNTMSLDEASPICILAFAVAADGATDDLTRAIRSCASFDDWATAASAYPDALAGSDPLVLVVEMCADEAMELAVYATCDSLHKFLASQTLTPMLALTSEEQRYCRVVDEFDRQHGRNIELQLEVYDPQQVRLLPSRTLAKSLAGAARLSNGIADRLGRLPDQPGIRTSVRLQVKLLRVEATMLRQYATFARKPTLRNRERAEKTRSRRQSTSTKLSAALSKQESQASSIAC